MNVICNNALLCNNLEIRCHHKTKHHYVNGSSCDWPCESSISSLCCVPYDDKVIATLVKEKITGKKTLLK